MVTNNFSHINFESSGTESFMSKLLCLLVCKSLCLPKKAKLGNGIFKTLKTESYSNTLMNTKHILSVVPDPLRP